MVKIIQIFTFLFFINILNAQQIENSAIKKLNGNEVILTSSLDEVNCRKKTTIDSILIMSGYDMTKKTAFVNGQNYAPFSAYLGESLSDQGSFWNLMSGYNNTIIKNASGYAAFGNYVAGRNDTIVDAYSSLILSENCKINQGYLNTILGSQNSKINTSSKSVILNSENSNISSLSEVNSILSSKNCNINSIPSSNSELCSILGSINCSINSSYKNAIIASSNSTVTNWGGNIVLIGANDCTVTNSNGFLEVKGHNHTVNTDGAYNSVNGSGNTIGYKSTLSTIANGYQLSMQGAHNTAINGQNSQFISDAASFHGFNTMLNGESNLIDKVSYNSMAGFGLLGYTSYQVSFGKFNVDKSSINIDRVDFNALDDLITIGNGSSSAAKSNALTLKKSGKFQINSIVGAKSIQDVEPEVTAEFIGDDAIAIPAGTTAQRPANPVNNSNEKAYIRYNKTTGKFEGFDLNTSTWVDLN